MNLDEIKKLIDTNESQTLEFKSSFNTDVIETLVAFANTNGGKVIIGVADKRKIKGVTINTESVQTWINEIKNKTYPNLTPDYVLFTIDNKQIVLFTISEYPIKPVAVRGRYYKRVGNSNHLLDIQEISTMHLNTFNTSWDSYITNYYTLDIVSLEKVNRFIELCNKNRETDITDDPLTVLHKFELIKEDKVSNACHLLFSKSYIFEAEIQAGRFSDAITIKDDITIRNDLFEQVEIVMTYVKKHINKEFIISSNPQHEERWQFPLPALREIIINMIVHRNYQDSGNSIIKIFDDHIEFFNPGHLPDSISIEQLMTGEYTSKSRNKKIASLFKEAGIIEQYGSGIQRVIKYFEAYELTIPVFENFQHGFRVSVFSKPNNKDNRVGDRVGDKVGDKVGDRVTPNQEIIMEIIQSNKYVSASELSKQVGISKRKIEENIRKLKESGKLKRIGSPKGGWWEIV